MKIEAGELNIGELDSVAGGKVTNVHWGLGMGVDLYASSDGKYFGYCMTFGDGASYVLGSGPSK